MKSRGATVNSGEVYGLLTVVEPRAFKTKGQSLNQCRCACGRFYAASSPDLIKGRVISCGCSRTTKKYSHGAGSGVG